MSSHPKHNFQRSSQAQIQAKREKGLCFYCDDKYTTGHRCRASTHILIVLDSKETFGDEVNWLDLEEHGSLVQINEQQYLQISFLSRKVNVIWPRNYRNTWAI